MDATKEAMFCLEAYGRGKLSLEHLVSRLEQLHNVFGEQSDVWRDSFFKEWVALEEVNAVVLNESRVDKSLVVDESAVVHTAIERLRKLLEVGCCPR